MKGSQRSRVNVFSKAPTGRWNTSRIVCRLAAVGMVVWGTCGCKDFKVPTAKEIASEFTGKDDEAKAEPKTPAAQETATANASVKTPPANVNVAPPKVEQAPAASPEQILADLEAKEFKIATEMELQSLVEGLGEKTDLVTKLDLENCPISAAGMKLLENFTQLQDLNLAGVSVTSDGFEPLAKLVALERLNLDHSSVDNEGLVHIRGLVQMKDLNLKRTQLVTDEGHYNLERMVALEKLDISSNPKIKGSGFVHARNAGAMPGLSELIANNTQFGQDGMGGIQGLKSLEVLEIGKTSLTNNGLGAFQKCKGIKRLLMGQNTSITDGGMAQLVVLKQLEHLELFNLNNVTNLGLSYVKGAKNLQYVNVDGTGITRDGVAALRKLIPKVKIKFNNKVIE